MHLQERDIKQEEIFYRKRVWLTIVVFGAIRIVLAGLLELGNDEAYYWLYSQHLQWNYFDHPPLIGLAIRLGTFNLAFDQYELFVRLSSVAGCALSSWFIYRTVLLIGRPRAAWWAVLLFNTSFYAAIVAGTLAMPDSPQLVFWTLSLWMIARICRNETDRFAWILFGIAAGLCVMSKVHGVFIWFGLGLFVLFHRRSWLRQPFFWLALLISLVIVSPLLIWNWQYDFITWRFHSARVSIEGNPVNLGRFGIELLSEILLANPVIALLILLALVQWRWKKPKDNPALTAFNFIALPFWGVLLFISVFRDVWPHWNAPAYITLIPIAAIALDSKPQMRNFPTALKLATFLFCAFAIAWPVTVLYYPGTFGNKTGKQLGMGDVTLDKYGWEKAGRIFADLYHQSAVKGQAGGSVPIVCGSWWGSHLEYYFAQAGDIPVVGLGDIGNLHQYAWLNQQRASEVNMSTAFAILPSIEKTVLPDFFYRYYGKAEAIDTIPVYRNGQPVQLFYVYHLSDWKRRELPVPVKRAESLAETGFY